MSSPTVSVLLWACIAAAVSTDVGDTPVSKVLELLDGLLLEVKAEGTNEAATYDQFACFCKSTTDSKSSEITSSRDTINTKSSSIAAKTATLEEREEELRKRKKDHEEWNAELSQTEATYAKAKSDYEIKEADLAKAINSLENAIQSLESSKPDGSSFLAVRDNVRKGIALAGVLNLIAESKRRVLDAFLQTHSAVDPTDPVFKYHSQGIIDVLNKLRTDFRAEKVDVDTEFQKTTFTYEATVSSLSSKISANAIEIDTIEHSTIPGLKSEIAGARSDLVGQEGILKDAQAYLKDLTVACEARANDWDQRSALRADEISKLEEAIHVLRTDVEAMDTQANRRALLLERSSSHLADVTVHVAGPSFLQEVVSRDQSHSSMHLEASTLEVKQVRASAFLRSEGARLRSTALSSVASHIEADPFGKVKGLIQRLIERLLKESTAEATKKGFCDEQLGKARKDRQYRLEETQDLNMEVKGLELKADELEAEIQMLTDALGNLREQLNTTTAERQTEHEENVETVKKAKSGLAGVQEAITILKVFYKQAAKANVLLQASPLVEDTSGPGFEGAYKGKQESSKAIIGMLEVIESDFDRTVRTTEAAEKAAHEAFVKLDRAIKSDISGKEQKKVLDEEDLVATRDKITAKMADLTTAQDLLDRALHVLEDLKPTCIDSGMSYADRVAKREEEIEALRHALCILDTEGVEGDCGGPGQKPQ